MTTVLVPYSAKFWWGETLANRSFQSFGGENVGDFTIASITYFSKSGIWLGKILANNVRFAKFAKVFPRQNFALYGIVIMEICMFQTCNYLTREVKPESHYSLLNVTEKLNYHHGIHICDLASKKDQVDIWNDNFSNFAGLYLLIL